GSCDMGLRDRLRGGMSPGTRESCGAPRVSVNMRPSDTAVKAARRKPMARPGRPIEGRTKWRNGKRISFLLDDDVYRPLAHRCIDADTSIQAFVVEAIREKLARDSRHR